MSLLQNNLNELFSIPLLIASGIYIRILLEIFGQSWRTKKFIPEHYCYFLNCLLLQKLFLKYSSIVRYGWGVINSSI